MAIDGWTHDSPDYDAAHDASMRREGCHVLRVTDDDVLRNLDGVVRSVLASTGRG